MIPYRSIGITERDIGDITVDNQLNGRYEGEIQVVKTPLKGHSHINHIATVSDGDLQLLTPIQPEILLNLHIRRRMTMNRLTTETRNTQTMHLDEMTIQDALLTINREDQKYQKPLNK